MEYIQCPEFFTISAVFISGTTSTEVNKGTFLSEVTQFILCIYFDDLCNIYANIYIPMYAIYILRTFMRILLNKRVNVVAQSTVLMTW